jgi:glyoxylase-like metal-dependent hydrolase (beta-lactamase superfamily II)
MRIHRVLTGGDRNFGYVLADEETKQAALVDPSYDPDQLVRWAGAQGYTVRHILTTHDHGDHTNGNARAKELTAAQIVMHERSAGDADLHVADGDIVAIGSLSVKAIYTPGHNPSHVCYYVEDRGERAVFTGDTLFVGKVGGTDFGEGARLEHESLHQKLMKLPDETRVLPGHDVGVRPESTIGDERRTNPFIQQPDFDAFVHLKKNWAEYKREHSIP